jgi:nitrite reductase/ring-hydroxylating ferredoxin subunit
MKSYKLFDSLEAAQKRIPLNSKVRVDAAGRKICVGHNARGFYAVDDTCPHLGASLSEGTTNVNNEIVCPWHSHRFNLSTGEECDRRSHDLKIHKVVIGDDGFFIEVY